MRVAFSMPIVDRSLSVPITLQMKNGQHSAPCRLEQMAAEVALVSGSRQAVLGILLDATLPAARRGRPAFRAVWVNEAMNRAYNMIRLAALSEKFAPPRCLDVTADEAERRIANEVATVLRSMDVDDDESKPCSEALGECQGSCRLNRVMIPPLDETAALAASMFGDANLRLVKSVPRCSLGRRSGARQPRHARARQGALRVAAGGSAPPISFVARRGLGTARSGRESRLSDRTGKQDLRCRRLDDSVAFRIKRDDANRCPVAGALPAPALRVACACILVERVAGGEHAAIQSGT